MSFKIQERSSIKAQGSGYYKEHSQLGDAMEKAINWLANQPVGTNVIITETATIPTSHRTKGD